MLFEERCADMFSLSRPIRVIASAPPGSVSRHDGHTAVVPPHLEEVHRMHVDAAGWRSRNSRESLIARLNLGLDKENISAHLSSKSITRIAQSDSKRRPTVAPAQPRGPDDQCEHEGPEIQGAE